MQMRKVIAVLGLSLAAVAIGGMPTRAAEDRPLGLKPPALVSCADAQHCDRDPAHLVNFVTKFYAWYVDNAVAEAVLTGAARDQNARTQKRILDRMLSPPFLANLAKLSKEVAAAHGEIPESDPSLSSLCGGADADNILCAQDFEGSWRGTASATVTAAQPDRVALTVTLPWPADQKQPPQRLAVTLVPAKGYWRIDKVAALDR